MTTRVLLVRHGATVLSAEDRFAESTDVELSAKGRAQVERLALRLADTRLAAVSCSPLKRTVETAAIASALQP
jgi:probable phosphoglycerate mutase